MEWLFLGITGGRRGPRWPIFPRSGYPYTVRRPNVEFWEEKKFFLRAIKNPGGPQSRGEPLFLNGRKNLFRGGPPPSRSARPQLRLPLALCGVFRAGRGVDLPVSLAPSLRAHSGISLEPLPRFWLTFCSLPCGCECFLSGRLFRFLVISLPKPSADRGVCSWVGWLLCVHDRLRRLVRFSGVLLYDRAGDLFDCLYEIDPAVDLRAIKKGPAGLGGCGRWG